MRVAGTCLGLGIYSLEIYTLGLHSGAGSLQSAWKSTPGDVNCEGYENCGTLGKFNSALLGWRTLLI